ncbi:biotin/lipoyl-binding protein [Stenotrophomonas maltophilia]|nr:biotin/lipoyl-binding protein [Stenotrophomonas maltophilia]
MTFRLLPATRRGRLILVALLALAVVAAAWWLLRKPAVPAVATAPVSRGDIEQTVEATGVIDAYKLVSVGAQASGQIKSLKVQLGDTVKEGDLIAEIDATTQQNQVLNAQASLDQVTAQRAVQQATLRQAELEFARQQQMLAAEATSRQEYDADDAQLLPGRPELPQRLQQAQQQLQAAWAARERYRARAVRLARREAERDARRTPAPAPDVKPALPAAAAAILARAKARASGKEQ